MSMYIDRHPFRLYLPTMSVTDDSASGVINVEALDSHLPSMRHNAMLIHPDKCLKIWEKIVENLGNFS